MLHHFGYIIITWIKTIDIQHSLTYFVMKQFFEILQNIFVYKQKEQFSTNTIKYIFFKLLL